MRLIYIQHVPYESPGYILSWAAERDVQVTGIKPYLGDSFVKPEQDDLLVIMGGPMSVKDEEKFTWLAEEKEVIKDAIDRGVKVLGICLGAQLIADLLGGYIGNSPEKEIGWFPVQFSPKMKTSPFFRGFPEKITVFHWHGETFSIPPGTFRIAGSRGVPNQAFEYRRQVIGLQFHLEVTPEIAAELTEVNADEITASRFVQSADSIKKQNFRYVPARRALFRLLDNICNPEKVRRITLRKKRR